ncbi:hypothetical protein Fmac_031671 [Flemingia macrophylla]|uniref:Uncharacterized protein n=1 Tax=Flemingia macrophylla TaxID=520843 RepID=A0ABD1L423_9FABA
MKDSSTPSKSMKTGEQCSQKIKNYTAKRRLTPRKSNSKTNTPKKTGSAAGSPVSPWKIDLRLEAKLSAEDDSRIYAGRKVHPFFSMWKLEKKNQQQEGGSSPSKGKERGVTCGPIHVFENVQDGVSPLDWSGWTFLNETTTAAFGPASLNLCSIEPLNFNNFSSALKLSSASISQNIMSCSDQLFIQQDNMKEISPTNSANLANEQAICPSKLEYAKVVCGNEEAVNFLRDWLHLWRERCYQHSNKDSKKQDNDDDHICSDSDCASVQNVLLITGPVGHEFVMLQSGKSAAVYACAQEQGFEILEINTSDCRKGAAVKQNLGEALKSHGVKRLLDHTLSSHTKNEKLLPISAFPNGIATEEMDDGMNEQITISDVEAHSPSGTSSRLHGKAFTHTLILVEDVDVLFPEDSGCIAAIQHISQTARGPIILTTNNKKVQKMYGSLPFDLEACHMTIPKILPWNYPSDLSNPIEKEVAKSITIMEENKGLHGLINKDLDINERNNNLDLQCMKNDYLDTKVARIKRSLTCSELESQHNAIYGLSNCYGQKRQSKLIVMSSDFKVMDEHSQEVFDESYKRHSLENNTQISSEQDSRDVNTETTFVCNMMDAWSHADFKLKSKIVESSTSADMVQNLWKKLRVCQKDLGQHVNPEQHSVTQVVKLTSGLTNLISEADLLLCNHQQKQNGIMEPPMSLEDEVTISWYDEQAMMSTIVVHGFCSYTKYILDVGSKFGCQNSIDLTSEMLDCNANVMALGKLSRQEFTESTSNHAKKQLEINNTTNDIKRTSLSKLIKSIIPPRSSMTMKGVALNEYISSLRQISISESYRISNGSGKMRKARRSAQHYLSRGSMMSPDDILLVCDGDMCGMISKQYAANIESNSA